MTNTVVGSDLEVMVYNWLVSHGYKPDVDFQFQSHLIGGYYRQLGDAIVDFLLLERNIAIRVQGTYWHQSIQENARDRIQKERLQALGYIVVDVWQQDLMTRLNYTMEQAIQGIELPHFKTYPHLSFPSRAGDRGQRKGVISIPGRVSGPTTIQGDLIEVYTKKATGVGGGEATLNGRLLHDGGMNCECQFKYESTGEGEIIEAAFLCYIFPWKFYDLLNLFSPNISLDFVNPSAVFVSQNKSTPWQSNKRAGDEFSETITGLTPGLFYSYISVAKNDVAKDEGESVVFS